MNYDKKLSLISLKFLESSFACHMVIMIKWQILRNRVMISVLCRMHCKLLLRRIVFFSVILLLIMWGQYYLEKGVTKSVQIMILLEIDFFLISEHVMIYSWQSCWKWTKVTHRWIWLRCFSCPILAKKNYQRINYI